MSIQESTQKTIIEKEEQEKAICAGYKKTKNGYEKCTKDNIIIENAGEDRTYEDEDGNILYFCHKAHLKHFLAKDEPEEEKEDKKEKKKEQTRVACAGYKKTKKGYEKCDKDNVIVENAKEERKYEDEDGEMHYFCHKAHKKHFLAKTGVTQEEEKEKEIKTKVACSGYKKNKKGEYEKCAKDNIIAENAKEERKYEAEDGKMHYFCHKAHKKHFLAKTGVKEEEVKTKVACSGYKKTKSGKYEKCAKDNIIEENAPEERKYEDKDGKMYYFCHKAHKKHFLAKLSGLSEGEEIKTKTKVACSGYKKTKSGEYEKCAKDNIIAENAPEDRKYTDKDGKVYYFCHKAHKKHFLEKLNNIVEEIKEVIKHTCAGKKKKGNDFVQCVKEFKTEKYEHEGLYFCCKGHKDNYINPPEERVEKQCDGIIKKGSEFVQCGKVFFHKKYTFDDTEEGVKYFCGKKHQAGYQEKLQLVEEN